MDPYTKVTWAYVGFAGGGGGAQHFLSLGELHAAKLGKSGACSTRNVFFKLCHFIWGDLQYIFDKILT